MPGPCSLPSGDRREWEKMNETICNTHKYCYPEIPRKKENGEELTHEWITIREWLFQRNRLRTGKSR
jgi:hypothetical protein